ncbi:MAG: TRAP transporter small permease [Rhodocyclaceae bacterium]
MNILTAVNSRLSRWAMYIACVCLAGLVLIVDYAVVMRYVFNDAPPFVEQVALLLVISVSMFGASAGVRDAGHIGLDSLVSKLPKGAQSVCALLVGVITITFAVFLFACGIVMAQETIDHTIPTLGISEAYRFLPPVIAGVLMLLFSLEHIVAIFTKKKVVPSWH